MGAKEPITGSTVKEIQVREQTDRLPLRGESEAFQTLGELRELMSQCTASGDADRLWKAVREPGQMPLLFGDTVAVFFYRGTATSVEARGDFELRYRRLGRTDVWWAQGEFEPDARVEYRQRLGARRWQLDPLNPLVETGGMGSESVVRMPGYVPPPWTQLPRPAVRGRLGRNITLASQSLGYDVNVRIYRPHGYEMLHALPSIYVVDGQEYADPQMGAMVQALDYLIAGGRVEPVIAVFIDARDPHTGRNRREEEFRRRRLDDNPLGEFIGEELVPLVDKKWRTKASAGSRALAGFSFGGMFAAHMGLAYPDVFGKVAIQSPYIVRRWVLDTYRLAERRPLEIFLSHGTYDEGASSLRLREILVARGYRVRYVERHEGHSFGMVRSQLGDLLTCFFGRG